MWQVRPFALMYPTELVVILSQFSSESHRKHWLAAWPSGKQSWDSLRPEAGKGKEKRSSCVRPRTETRDVFLLESSQTDPASLRFPCCSPPSPVGSCPVNMVTLVPLFPAAPSRCPPLLPRHSTRVASWWKENEFWDSVINAMSIWKLILSILRVSWTL